jgi:Putative MetA-pathway of phenol degradation
MTVRVLAVGWLVVASVAGVPLPGFAQNPHGGRPAANPAPRLTERAVEDLETDRPDITESSSVVGAGLWQLETGVLFQSDRTDPVTAHDTSAPNVLMRIGVSSRMEIRIGGEGFLAESLSTPGSSMATGASDLELGLKYKFVDQSRAGVDISVIPIISMPTGSDAFTTGGYDPTVKLVLQRDLPRGFGIGGNLIFASITEDNHRFTQTSVSASLGHDLKAGWAGFWELYGASALSRDGGRAWLFDTGVTHTIGKNVQIDVSVGRGLTTDAPDWFLGAGFAIRGFFTR